jgi:GT2 family glycosyltransferase
MSAAPLISVVVVNWNRRDLLAGCLRSLAAQTFREFEAVVVDNGSTDGSLDLVREPEFAWVRLVANGENLGFCAANNRGIAAARGRLIALLNNDAEADPNWLAEFASAAERYPGHGMFASKIVSWDDPRRLDKIGHLIYPDGQNRGRGTGEIDAGQYDHFEETAWPDGCAALYRREVFDRVGGFDEDFFAYADDAELGLRARIAGYRCMTVPTARVRHRLGSTLGRYSPKRLFLIERNRIWLVAKLFPMRRWPAAPFYYAARLAAGAAAAAAGRGDAARAGRELGGWALLECLLRAHLAAAAGLPRILRKRRQLRAIRTLSGAEVSALLRRFRIPLAELVSQASPESAASPR